MIERLGIAGTVTPPPRLGAEQVLEPLERLHPRLPRLEELRDQERRVDELVGIEVLAEEPRRRLPQRPQALERLVRAVFEEQEEDRSGAVLRPIRFGHVRQPRRLVEEVFPGVEPPDAVVGVAKIGIAEDLPGAHDQREVETVGRLGGLVGVGFEETAAERASDRVAIRIELDRQGRVVIDECGEGVVGHPRSSAPSEGLSIQRVTGPSFSSSTCIDAPKVPVSTRRTPSSRSSSTNRS